MKYNFDESLVRRNSNSCKWDSAQSDDVLPMWVADMDFRAAPPIRAALEEKVRRGIFGYTRVPPAYFDAITMWFERRHHWVFNEDALLYTTGVLPALSAILRALTNPGDKVIVQTPVYSGFFPVIRNNQCEALANDLIYKEGTYTMDFDDLEDKAAHSGARLFLLCSPHNPSGRVWTKEELVRAGEICLKHKVLVISDEIHCDLTFTGRRHLPFALISDDFLYNSVTATSPSKTFNLAGLQVANVIAADKETNMRIKRALHTNGVSEINAFAIEALIAAYNEGEEWLDELNVYVYENYCYLKDFLNRQLPHLSVVPLEGTYLVWIDCSALKKASVEIAGALLEKERLWVNAGTMYGDAGEGFIRLNIACPRETLKQGLERLQRYFG